MKDRKKPQFLIVSFVFAFIALSLSSHIVTGTAHLSLSAIPMPTPASGIPPYSSYKGVTIGTPVADARAKLGSPKEKSDEQDFWMISDNESVQIYYDAAKRVNAISVTYMGKLNGVPDPMAIFGEDAEKKPDGAISKMVRYPKAGFWISYNKTGGDDPLVMIAIQKM